MSNSDFVKKTVPDRNRGGHGSVSLANSFVDETESEPESERKFLAGEFDSVFSCKIRIAIKL